MAYIESCLQLSCRIQHDSFADLCFTTYFNKCVVTNVALYMTNDASLIQNSVAVDVFTIHIYPFQETIPILNFSAWPPFIIETNTLFLGKLTKGFVVNLPGGRGYK